jgi:hypothetical protein
MPVLLTIAALRRRWSYLGFDHCWPGVLFSHDDEPITDVDVLLSNGSRVFAAECKLDARGLDDDQADKLLRFAERTGSTPVIAALAGAFDPSIVSRVVAADGLVMERADVLPPIDPPTT